ncbi:NADPH oxidase 5-like isoform X2 [Dreissena polymorpha]|uniref:NADPH oxidase 5-like isoform X2 n=1 Tax=Dreissena polymorpha TaxID=45954 RepID=UPI0022646017|nr:NADPH oxidase 5-like isoform X2 [Dreissena polymorpha]
MPEINGVLNPSFLHDVTGTSQVGTGHKPHGKRQTDPINVNQSAVIRIPEDKQRVVKSDSAPPEKAPASDHDVKVTITDYTKKDKTTLCQQDSAVLLRPLARRRPGTVVDSLRKAENPPPLDEDSLNFSEERIKGRKLMYMQMGPMTDEDAKWLNGLECKFKEFAGDDGQIDQQEFQKALGLRKSFFAERFFELFDLDGSGDIKPEELVTGMRMLLKGTPAQKLQFLFDVYDADGSGSIDRDELMNVLKACMEESSLSLTDENLADLTDALFDTADEDESGTITFEELRNELEKHPGVIENLTISAAQWLRPPDKKNDGKSRFRYFTADYCKNNLRKVIYFWLFWILNAVLFAMAMYQYRAYNVWLMLARGGGLCLNFNCAWVLVLMLRKCITFLRMTKLCQVLPFDQHILFHKMTAFAIAFFAVEHMLAHIGNAVVLTVGNAANETQTWEVLFTTVLGLGLVEGWAYITGWILMVILIVIVICSHPFVRRSGHFQVFYWTHMLYVPFWILLILHCKRFWMFIVGPGVLFLLEKVSRSKLIKMARFGDTYIEEVNLLPSGVTHLVITRPTNFRFRPGDYIFIQIPEIATYEWHPFTISSAPEMEGHIWLHVRSAGHWTRKLYEYFDKHDVNAAQNADQTAVRRRGTSKKFVKIEQAYARQSEARKSRASRKSSSKPSKQTHKVVNVKCFIDGPYGTGTREVFDTEHAVLIGAGIGVTPMASILQSVWYRFTALKQTCPNCDHVWYPIEEEEMDMNLKKVDFVWINRDQKSFEWFLTLLNQIEMEQSDHHGPLENCIQMHMYMTAAQKKTDMKGIGLQIALDLMYEKSHRDLITGLRTKTEPGRPNWNKIFKAIKDENKGKVKVFFCGAPALGKTVKEAAAKFGFAFSKENF